MSKHNYCKHYYKLLSIIKEKDEEIAELKKRLQHYENYNSPPSANSLLWKVQREGCQEVRRYGKECWE